MVSSTHPPSSPHPPPATPNRHTEKKRKGGKKKRKTKKETPERRRGSAGVARAAASLKRAHKCGRWAAGEDSFAPGRTLCNYGRTPARPGFFKAEGRGGRGRGSKNDNPERSAEFGALLKCCRFLLQPFSFASLPRHPLVQPPTPGLARASLFFRSWKKRSLPGALNLRAGGLLAGRAGRGDSGRRGVLPGEVRPPRGWTEAPGAAGG